MQPGRDFELICGTDILVETRQRRRLVARDGERARMTGPFRFRFRPGALRVLVPEASA
jgi:diacylglycerol kinase family enzyme